MFFFELEIPEPDVNLNVGSGEHGAMTAEILRRFEAELLERKPDAVIVYGDTNTTLAGALAASKLGIPLAHVEAGLRSFVRAMPEEINRRMTDHVSDLLFAPTAESVKNLKKEHTPGEIHRVGDLMYELLDRIDPLLEQNESSLKRFKLTPGEYALVTAHRPATVDSREGLMALLGMLEALPHRIVFPMHPRTVTSFKRHRLQTRLKALSHVRVIEPLSYVDNLTLARFAALVMTDSGGLQKEAVLQGVKCLTLRDETEWTETLNYGNHLVGLSVRRLKRALSAPHPSKNMRWKVNGRAPSGLIIDRTLEFIGR